MKRAIAAIFAGSLLALSGLAFADPPARGQSHVAQTAESEYAVIVRGERGMQRRDVAAAAMLRAAQFTLESGHQWFIVSSATTTRINLATAPRMAALAGETGRAQDAVPRSSTETSQGGGHGATAGADPGAVGVGTGVDSRLLEQRPPRMVYQTILLIRVGEGSEVAVENPEADLQIFDAASIAAQLGGG